MARNRTWLLATTRGSRPQPFERPAPPGRKESDMRRLIGVEILVLAAAFLGVVAPAQAFLRTTARRRRRRWAGTAGTPTSAPRSPGRSKLRPRPSTAHLCRLAAGSGIAPVERLRLRQQRRLLERPGRGGQPRPERLDRLHRGPEPVLAAAEACNVINGRLPGPAGPGTGPIFVNPYEFPPSSTPGLGRLLDAHPAEPVSQRRDRGRGQLCPLARAQVRTVGR